MQADVIVLGAGIVGTSVAVHLAQRGKSVVLVDRRGPGEETSYGNAGLIQIEGVLPYTFPRDFGKLLRYARNDRTDMHYHPTALPGIAGFLYRYWWNSAPERYRPIVEGYAPFILHAVDEHAKLIEAAGAQSLISKNGWYRLFRTAQSRDEAFREAEQVRAEWGVAHEQLTGAELHRREPGLSEKFAGVLHWTGPWSITDPGALVVAYSALLERLGGKFIHGDAQTLEQKGRGWVVDTAEGEVEAAEVVVALGPWAGDLTSRLGYRYVLGVKRGYHMHYVQPQSQALTSWVHDTDRGYMLCPMDRGIRLTTGAEFAPRDADSTPIQLERAEVSAREMFPNLGARVEAEPWRGARPCTVDMKPIIGQAPRHKSLWFAFGHAHHGMTLGPATGRLLAEMMTGEPTFVDAKPFAPTRFGAV